MSTNKITAEVRETTGKGVARKLRAAGRIPAVLYGQGHDGVSLTLDSYELNQLLTTSGAKTSVLELEVKDGGKGPRRNVLIKEVQKHPYKDIILHMDLLEIAMDEEISVMVPIEIVGTAKGVRLDGGILEMKRRELEIVCLPHIIPDSLTIDVTDLEIGDNIHVEDVKVPVGVTIPHDTNFTILTLVAPAVEVEEEEELVEGEEVEEGEGEPGEKESDTGEDEEE
ncbi:MAG: 50S ribosomal protein L25/general stress protein Ctc [bacterium]|nr:50S ribosomal protein L25/general stress protein Ctc [bacterium]MDT8366033.1 50S ribosomal protein L25/general stress protein Ctc [bacterium]